MQRVIRDVIRTTDVIGLECRDERNESRLELFERADRRPIDNTAGVVDDESTSPDALKFAKDLIRLGSSVI